MRHEDYMKEMSAQADQQSDVNKPSHYTQTNMECKEAIEGMLGDHVVHAWRANILKYIWRYQEKGGIQDLEKAQVYLGFLIQYEKENETWR